MPGGRLAGRLLRKGFFSVRSDHQANNVHLIWLGIKIYKNYDQNPVKIIYTAIVGIS